MKTDRRDVIELIAAHRPTCTTIDTLWPQASRVATLGQVLSDRGGAGPVQRRGSVPRRWITAGAVVACVATAGAVAAVVLPSDAPGGPRSAAAATLERLAVTTGSAPGNHVGPDQFVHLVVRSERSGTATVVRESWTAHDGRVWAEESWPGQAHDYLFPASGSSLAYPSPAYLATLPTDPGALQRYLRTHVSGSMSTDEAVFEAVGNLLRAGFAPPALRAAAVRVLERMPKVVRASSALDSIGRPALRVDFVDQRIRPDETRSLLVDPATAALLEDRDAAPEGTFTGTVTEQGAVDSVPQRVLNAARPGKYVPPPSPPAPSGSSVPSTLPRH